VSLAGSVRFARSFQPTGRPRDKHHVRACLARTMAARYRNDQIPDENRTEREPGMAEPDPGIPLADLIDAIRAELETAAITARNRSLQFEVKDVQLEVEVTTTGTRGAEGGLKVWALTVGASGSRANTASQKVTLTLSAVGPDGAKFQVSDASSRPVRRG
jgi:hypothetical protein